MASFKAFLLIIVFATITVAIDEFKNQKQLAQCIKDCHEPITACLKQHESACAKAYIHCHTQKDFLVCIQSANSLMMQSIGKCMKETCKPIQETQKQLKNHENQEMGEEFRWFNRPKEVKDAADKDDDIQVVPETAVKPTDSKGKNGN